MHEVHISPQVVIQLMDGKPIRFTHAERQESGDLHLKAVAPDKYFAHVTNPRTDRGTTQIQTMELSQQQIDTLGWSAEHGSFIGRF
jgi:hypothetical protein